MDESMLRIGHRGTTSGGLENTPPAFQKALRGGADGVELDIRMTKDGTLVVLHDPKIDRMTEGKGYVRDLSIGELKSFKIKGTDARIATSEEAFDAILGAGRPKAIQVDLKVSGAGPQLLEQIYRRNLQDVVIISSFHKDLLGEIRALDGKIKTGLIKIMPSNGPIEYLAPECDENKLKSTAKNALYRLYLYSALLINRISGSAFPDLIKDAKEIRTDYVMFYWRAATKSFIKKAHKNGFKVVAGMVNNEKGINRLERLGVDAIVTDFAELLRPKEGK